MISAAQPGESVGEPTRLEHSQVLFDYLVDATPVVATCPEATGRLVPATDLPFVKPTSASNGTIAGSATVPPWMEICCDGSYAARYEHAKSVILRRPGYLARPSLFPIRSAAAQSRRRSSSIRPSPRASAPRRRIRPRRTTGRAARRRATGVVRVRWPAASSAARISRRAADVRRSIASIAREVSYCSLRSRRGRLHARIHLHDKRLRLRLAVDRQPHGVFAGHGP